MKVYKIIRKRVNDIRKHCFEQFLIHIRRLLRAFSIAAYPLYLVNQSDNSLLILTSLSISFETVLTWTGSDMLKGSLLLVIIEIDMGKSTVLLPENIHKSSAI